MEIENLQKILEQIANLAPEADEWNNPEVMLVLTVIHGSNKPFNQNDIYPHNKLLTLLSAINYKCKHHRP